MPNISRLFVKTSIVYFVLALVAGVLTRAEPLGLPAGIAAGIFPTYVHLFVFGWLTQLIMGVALWLFPKYSSEHPRGHTALSWAAYLGINVGLAMRAVAEPGMFLSDAAGGPWSWALVASAILQWGGGLAFVVNVWPRVRGR